MKRNTQVLATYSECARDLDKPELMNFVVHGRTSTGKDVKTTIKCEWYFIPYFIDGMKQAWEKERTRRIIEINSIDAALPKS